MKHQKRGSPQMQENNKQTHSTKFECNNKNRTAAFYGAVLLFVSGGGDTEPADAVCGLLKAMLISCSVQRAFLPR